MQHLRINFGGIWRFELDFFFRFFVFFLLKKSGLILKSSGNNTAAHRKLTSCAVKA